MDSTKIEFLSRHSSSERQEIFDTYEDIKKPKKGYRTTVNLGTYEQSILDTLLSYSPDDCLNEIAGKNQTEIINTLIREGFERLKDTLNFVEDPTPEKGRYPNGIVWVDDVDNEGSPAPLSQRVLADLTHFNKILLEIEKNEAEAIYMAELEKKGEL